MKRKLAMGSGVLLVAFLLAQLVPVTKTNPPERRSIAWDSPRTEALARAACFDCHSNETRWPWYSSVAPVSWFVANHVNEGREELNFSTGRIELREARREISQDKMPMGGYSWLHPEARLSAQDRAALADGLDRTFGGARQNGGENHEERRENHEEH